MEEIKYCENCQENGACGFHCIGCDYYFVKLEFFIEHKCEEMEVRGGSGYTGKPKIVCTEYKSEEKMEKYNCHLCAAVFGDADLLDFHLRNAHAESVNPPSWIADIVNYTVTCKNCREKFKGDSDYEAHNCKENFKYKPIEPKPPADKIPEGLLNILLEKIAQIESVNNNHSEAITALEKKILDMATPEKIFFKDTETYKTMHAQIEVLFNKVNHLEKNIPNDPASNPYRCPICLGCGNTKGVPRDRAQFDFYKLYAACQTCNGKGVLWS